MTPDPMEDLRQIDRPDRTLAPSSPPSSAPASSTSSAPSHQEEPCPRPTDHDRARPRAYRRLHTITPYLAVSDARAAMAWYQDIFGATLASEPIVMPDGRIGHVELRIGDAVFMMADEFADIDVLGPSSHEAAPRCRS